MLPNVYSLMLLAVVSVLLPPGGLHAAPGSKGTLHELLEPQLVLAVVRFDPPQSRGNNEVKVVAHDVIRGTPVAEPLTIHMPNGVSRLLSPDVEYLVVYTEYRKAKGPSNYVMDPAGPRALSLLGAEPTVFRNSNEWRRILQGEIPGWPDNPGLFQEHVVSLDHPVSSRLSTFYAYELLLNPVMLQALSAKTIGWLTKLAGNIDVDTGLRTQILITASVRPGFSKEAVLKVAHELLLHEPLPFDLNSTRVGLVISAINVLQRFSDKSHAELLVRYINSNHPGVVERAALSLEQLRPGQGKLEVNRAIENNALQEASVRRTLKRLRDQWQR